MADARLPAIGIIGGMGPVATGAYYSMLLARFQEHRGATHNSDYPAIHVYGMAGVDNVGQPPADHRLPAALATAVDWLNASGAKLIGVPCNSVHHALATLRPTAPIPILDIVDLTSESLQTTGSPTLLLATRRTVHHALYQHHPRAAGRDFLIPSDADQDLVDRLILGRNAGEVGDAGPLLDLIARYPTARSVLLGCTELAGHYVSLHSAGMQAVDSLRCLADETYRAAIEMSTVATDADTRAH